MLDAEQGNAFRLTVTPHVEVIRQETDGNLLFETRDRGRWVHRSYLTK
jgi:hypothetical protein